MGLLIVKFKLAQGRSDLFLQPSDRISRFRRHVGTRSEDPKLVYPNGFPVSEEASFPDAGEAFSGPMTCNAEFLVGIIGQGNI